MRQVFTSPRLENVETVAKLLRDADIQIKVSEGRGYKQVSRREFSYVDKKGGGNQAAIWVVKPEDYKRAREMLHGMGLLDATPIASYVPESLQFKQQAAPDRQKSVMKIRIALLFIVGALGAAAILRHMFLP